MSGWNRLGHDCPIRNGDRKHKECHQSTESGLIFCHDDKANPIGWIFRGFDTYGFGVWQDEADDRETKFQAEAIGGTTRQASKAYQIGINTKIVGKTGANQLSYAGAFRPKSFTLAELAIHCGQQGHPWMPAVLDRKARRYQQHANFTEVLTLDVDGGLTIEEAKSHPFIAAHCGLGIETASSSPELNKFRLVFPLTASIQGWQTIRICNLYLQWIVKVADPSCKDACRFYFGATGRFPFLSNEAASLPESFVQDALDWHWEQERIAEEQYREALRRAEERRAQYGEQSEQERYNLIEQALDCIPPRQPGSGNYDEWLRILAALVHELGEADAIALVERYSPSIKGSTWNVPKKARSFRRGTGRPATLGTLFYLAKGHGFRFPPSERKSFEVGEPDRAAYQAYVEAEQERDRCEQAQSQEQSQLIKPPKRDRLIAKRLWRFRQFWHDLQRDFLLPEVVNGNEIRWTRYEGFASVFDLFSDTTCLQGWLGAGKTESILRSLMAFQDRTIVLVSPRNGLLRQTAQRAKRLNFDIYHYQDDARLHKQMLRSLQPGLYLMAPDSLKSYAVDQLDWSQVILVIDEFSGIRKEILKKTTELPQYLNAIRQCSSLIVADAFLSQIDLRVIRKHRAGSIQVLQQNFRKSPVKIKWLECRNNAGDLSFSHDGIYYSLLDRWIEAGFGRIAIAVDSLHIAKLLNRYLTAKGVKTWIVCSETPQENHSFMPKPDAMIEQGQIEAVIYTPTAQSGLDIQSQFDRGLLICTGTLSPLQMLQKLGRCRQCPEWYVSAPRHAAHPDCVTPTLDGKKIQQWAEQITQTLSDSGFNTPLEVQSWGVWEELTRNVEKAFTSEYVFSLLDYFFESVETLEVESNRVGEWRKDSQLLKSKDMERILSADLQKGLRLVETDRQPTLNTEVWDIKLAHFATKYPEVAKNAIADLKQSHLEVERSTAEIHKLGGSEALRSTLSELKSQIEQATEAIELLNERLEILTRIVAEDPSLEHQQGIAEIEQALNDQISHRSDTHAQFEQMTRLLQSARGEIGTEAIELTKLFHSRRVEKLKNYVMATEPNDQDDRDLLQYLRERPTHYHAGNFKRLRHFKLFRYLDLGKLAVIEDRRVIEADTNAYCADSPEIAALYQQFLANAELVRLFPLIESQKSFFIHIKACLSDLGYERGGKTIRVATVELNPNGRDRKGNQRETKSKTVYFVYWMVMECSGSEYFREHWAVILAAMRDRLSAEREERAKQRERKEQYESPPPGWEASVA